MRSGGERLLVSQAPGSARLFQLPSLPHCSQRVPTLNACLSHSTKLSFSICFLFARARSVFLF